MVGRKPTNLPASLSDGLRLFVYTRYVLSYYYCCIYSDNFLATSVDVEHVFSNGRLVLSHVRNGLSVQSTRALMCLGAWSKMGFVKDKDITEAARLPDIKGSEDELNCGWDNIL